MRFKQLDLNLLVVFDALMETRSVTRTAERLGLTQPAASASLHNVLVNLMFNGRKLQLLIGLSEHRNMSTAAGHLGQQQPAPVAASSLRTRGPVLREILQPDPNAQQHSVLRR